MFHQRICCTRSFITQKIRWILWYMYVLVLKRIDFSYWWWSRESGNPSLYSVIGQYTVCTGSKWLTWTDSGSNSGEIIIFGTNLGASDRQCKGNFYLKKKVFCHDRASFLQALVSAMLDVDPKKRPTALELCKHPWFADMDSLPNTKLSNIQDYNLVRVRED